MSGLLIYILFLHFLGDFVFQSDRMAQGKSKSARPLLAHVATYSFVLFAGLLLVPMVTYDAPFGAGAFWAALYAFTNGVIHLAVDFVTSRINSKLWADKKVHWFFVGVGADQFIHAATLIYFMWLLP